MSEQWKFSAQITARQYDEAIRLISASQQSKGLNWSAWLSMAVCYGFGGLGGLALVLAIADGDLSNGVGVPPGLATLGLVGSLIFVASLLRISEVLAARNAATHPMNETFEIEINAAGVSFDALSSASRATWAVIDDVVEGREVIAISSAGMVTPIPCAGLDDPGAVAAQMRRWHEATR